MVEAGFILQIDDPGVMTSWDMIKPEPSVAEYRRHLAQVLSARALTDAARRAGVDVPSIV